MAKNLEISFLLDFYGDMLTEKQRDVIEYYYNEDLSLSEIAENQGISRQGVRDAIKRSKRSCWTWKNAWACSPVSAPCATALSRSARRPKALRNTTTALAFPERFTTMSAKSRRSPSGCAIEISPNLRRK